MPVPNPRVAVAAIGRAVQRGDARAERDARRDLTAATINAAIDRALASSAAPLKREHATELAARLKAAAR